MGGRVGKRSFNACERCRRQKIRCVGRYPCDACSRRSVACRFNDWDLKVSVTKGYIEELQHKAAQADTLQKQLDEQRVNEHADGSRDGSHDRRLHPTNTSHNTSHSITNDDEDDDNEDCENEDDPPRLVNPLSSGPSQFITTPEGSTMYLGTSSDWSFTRRILSLTHELLHRTPLPPQNLMYDGSSYDLDWPGSRRRGSPPRVPVLPTLDYAIFLINAVKFHCGQLFHLFDEDTFMQRLYAFYDRDDDANDDDDDDDVWHVHLLLVLAFGKAFTTKTVTGRRPPGSAFFCRAMYDLPDVTVMWKRPVEATEVYCCIALYLQSIDYRQVAYNYIGQAMRVALGQGLATDMPVAQMGHAAVERARRAWWTVYVLDREMTSLMGLPQSIHDEDVHPQVPTFSGSTQRSRAFRLQIDLSRVIANINRTVYGADGRLDRLFLRSTKRALNDIAGVADELRRGFALPRDESDGVSRTSAHLHLRYHQCIVLATRPLLCCFLKIRLENPSVCAARLAASTTVCGLIQMCLDSSHQAVGILAALQTQGLLETFLPFDLESLFISTSNTVIGRTLEPQLGASPRSTPQVLRTAFGLYDEFASVGNQVAVHQKAELLRLDAMLTALVPDVSGVDPAQPESTTPTYATYATDVTNATDLDEFHLMTSADVLGMANSIDLDAEWTQAMFELGSNHVTV